MPVIVVETWDRCNPCASISVSTSGRRSVEGPVWKRTLGNRGARKVRTSGSTIENVILAFEPQRMISINVSKAPAGLPFPNAIRQMRLPPWPALACYLMAASVLALGYAFDRSTCVWRTITGLPCPGCGMIHAFLSLAHGDLRGAWAFNRGSIAALPLLLWAGTRRVMELIA